MMREDPLIICTSSRSGSSLLTGIFIKHGFFLGEARDIVGYDSYENKDIYSFVHHARKINKWEIGEPIKNPEETNVRGVCSHIFWDKGIWVHKTLAELYPIWKYHFPHMFTLLLKRDIGRSLESLKKRGYKNLANARRIITKRYSYMDQIAEENPRSLSINVDKIVAGNFNELETVCNLYGIQFDPQIVNDVFDPRLWH